MSEMPQFVTPMLAKLSVLPSDKSLWAFEVKWDGIRAIACCEPGRLSLLTRNEIDLVTRGSLMCSCSSFNRPSPKDRYASNNAGSFLAISQPERIRVSTRGRRRNAAMSGAHADGRSIKA